MDTRRKAKLGVLLFVVGWGCSRLVAHGGILFWFSFVVIAVGLWTALINIWILDNAKKEMALSLKPNDLNEPRL